MTIAHNIMFTLGTEQQYMTSATVHEHNVRDIEIKCVENLLSHYSITHD